MSDQCENCTLKGYYKKCIETPCMHHQSWIARQHIDRIKKLENSLKITRDVLKACVEDL